MDVMMSYKDAVAEIEMLLHKMENDEPDIDAMVAQVKRVSELLTFCKKKLFETEQEVQKVLDAMEN